MTEEHFQKEMNRLAERFGAQHYKQGFQRLLWKDVKDLSESWFTAILSEFIYCARQAPLGEEFRQKVASEREHQWKNTRPIDKKSYDASLPNNPNCSHCRDVGILVHDTYAYRCCCSAGRLRQERFPLFRP
jgi:hypothetical protein